MMFIKKWWQDVNNMLTEEKKFMKNKLEVYPYVRLNRELNADEKDRNHTPHGIRFIGYLDDSFSHFICTHCKGTGMEPFSPCSTVVIKPTKLRTSENKLEQKPRE